MMLLRLIQTILSCTLLIIITGCGGSGGSGSGNNDNGADDKELQSQTEFLPPIDNAEFDKPALDQIPTYLTGEGVSSSELLVSSDGAEYYGTRLSIHFSDDATVEQLELLFKQHNAKVVSSVAGAPVVSVQIPMAADMDELITIKEQLQSEDFIISVALSPTLSQKYIPPYLDSELKVPGTTVYSPEFHLVGHHLAVNAHAAWNLRGTIKQPPVLAIYDYFGNGSPKDNFNIQLLSTNNQNTCSINATHGYSVLGIFAAELDNATGGPRERVTGLFPREIPVDLVDGYQCPKDALGNEDLKSLSLFDALLALLAKVDQRAIDEQRKVIINMSIAYSLKEINSTNFSSLLAKQFLVAVRYLRLEDKSLFFVPAGNYYEQGERVDNSSPVTMAGQAFLLDQKGVQIPNLTNVVVVENRKAGYFPYDANCLWGGDRTGNLSVFGGDISAIGSTDFTVNNGIFSFTTPSTSTTDIGVGLYHGSSLSSPQAAAIGAFVWAVKPELSAQEVKKLLLASAEEVNTNGIIQNCHKDANNNYIKGAPLVDSYAALLATDSAEALQDETRRDKAPIRKYLLDIACGAGCEDKGNDIFDHHDLDLWLKKLKDNETDYDFSRYDLNANGITGGPETERFNLDIDEDHQYEEIGAPGGGSTTIAPVFNEEAVTDFDILCYYAHSTLYEGDETVRSSLPKIAGCMEFARWQTDDNRRFESRNGQAPTWSGMRYTDQNQVIHVSFNENTEQKALQLTIYDAQQQIEDYNLTPNQTYTQEGLFISFCDDSYFTGCWHSMSGSAKLNQNNGYYELQFDGSFKRFYTLQGDEITYKQAQQLPLTDYVTDTLNLDGTLRFRDIKDDGGSGGGDNPIDFAACDVGNDVFLIHPDPAISQVQVMLDASATLAYIGSPECRVADGQSATLAGKKNDLNIPNNPWHEVTGISCPAGQSWVNHATVHLPKPDCPDLTHQVAAATGSVNLLKEASFMSGASSDGVLCLLLSGTGLQWTGKAEPDPLIGGLNWNEVVVLNGDCAEKQGWISATSISAAQ